MSAPDPLVSVLLPVRDAVATLARALGSLARQTVHEHEVVIVDDGSTDGSLDVARDAARRDPRIRVTASPPRGIVAALNTAARRARADLFVRMDADDVAHPRRLAGLAAAAGLRPDVGLLAHRVRLQPRDRLSEGMRRYEAWVNGVVTHEAIVRDRFVECPLPHPTWAVRRGTFERLGGYHDGPFPEDYDFFLRAIDAGVRCHKVPEVLLTWSDGPDRLSRTDPRYGLDRFVALKVRHLVPVLDRAARRVGFVGAPRAARRWQRRLEAAGIALERRIDPEDVDATKAADDLILLVVVAPGARRGVRRRLAAQGFVDGATALCCA